MIMMKKVLIILLILLLSGCTTEKTEDYYQLSVDDYLITVGYDDVEYLKLVYDFDVPAQFEADTMVDNIDVLLHKRYFGAISLKNTTNKLVSGSKAKLTKLTIYVDDLKGRVLKINNIELDDSIKKNCNTFDGSYIERNGYACVIQNKVEDKLNVIELYGDYLNIDQDKLNRVIISIE